MNEALVKELIRCKLAVAGRIIEFLPPELSKEVKKMGRVFRECLAENAEAKPKERISNIRIE
ncbi:MAG: hypothetical protein ACM3ZR_04415 [Pseudomonadota bacterium]